MWARTFLRFGVATVAWNFLMAGGDDDEFIENYKKAWDEGHLRWMEADITKIAALKDVYFGGKGSHQEPTRKYFNVLGHFRDPIKWVANPLDSARHKSSVLSSFFWELFTGEDWKGQKFTTFAEFWGRDDKGEYQRSGKRKDGSRYRRGDPKGGQLKYSTVKWEFGGGGAVRYDEVPSFLINQARGVLPIPIQNGIEFLMGEIDAFDAMTKSAGLMTSTSRPKK